MYVKAEVCPKVLRVRVPVVPRKFELWIIRKCLLKKGENNFKIIYIGLVDTTGAGDSLWVGFYINF